MQLLSNSYFALFSILAIGLILGRLKLFGLSLGVSAVIFVALVFGHYGVVIPVDFQIFGLVLFIFTVGIQAGPGFFESFKKEGRQLTIFALLLIVMALIVTVVVILVFDVNTAIAVGLFTGALTSTPGLAAAIDYTGSPLSSIGYGIGYPFGVVGVILFIRLMPRILKAPVRAAEQAHNAKLIKENPEILMRNFVVDNDHVIGKTVGELRINSLTGAIISRLLHDDVASVITADSVLHKGDIVKAVGPEEALKNVELLIGTPTTKEIVLDGKYDVRSVLVTNEKVVNRTIGELNLLAAFNATITRIRRSGIDISPSSGSKLQFGDKLVIASSKADLEIVTRLIGNDQKRLSDTDILPVSLGILLGVFIGMVSVNLGDVSFSLGLTGGVLIVALVLSRIGKTGPLLWTMTGAANQLMRQLGLLLFLATVGTHAGAEIVRTFDNYGIELFLYGAVITILPMFLAAIVGKLYLKMDILKLMGAISGSMTSTPGLAAADSMTNSNAHSIAYATVYPVAMVMLIVCVQLITSLF